MTKMLCLIAAIAILMLAARPCAAQGDSPAANKAELLKSLNAVGEGDWRTARPLAQQTAGATDKAYETLRDLWPKIERRVVKGELVNAFTQSVHPDGLKIALLALDDPDAVVRKSGVTAVAMGLGLSFEMTPEEAKKEALARRGMTLEAAREARAREIVAALKSAKPGDVPKLLEYAPSNLWRSKRLREVSAKAGLFDVIRPLLNGPGATAATQNAVVNVLVSFDPPEATLAEVLTAAQSPVADDEVRRNAFFLLGQKRYHPAYAILKERLQKPLTGSRDLHRYRPAEALALFGEPETIPLLIGVVAADNDRSIYDVGYYALRPLTGVPYNELHDGNWWKLWWEAHKGELPENVRSLSIPDLPRTTDYREPLPREAHSDRAKQREALLARYQENLKHNGIADCSTLAALLGPAAIPDLIGLIASDNTYNTIYGAGYFGLTPLTGVPYSSNHDATWWKLWREAHLKELPDAARAPIPDFPRSPSYREPLTPEIWRDADKRREKLVADLRTAEAQYTEEATFPAFTKAQDRVSELKDARVVPDVIELLPEKSGDPLSKFYYLEYFILTPLTGVPYAENRTRQWWRDWLKSNRAELEKRYPPTTAAPDPETVPYKPGNAQKPIQVAQCPYDPEIAPAGGEAADENPKDIADVPSVRRFAGGDRNKLYRLVGLDTKATPPADGYSLLLILPGGDGSEEFRWFIRRIKKNALPEDMIVAQLIAPQWSEWQAQNLVWPTRKNPFFGMKFPTEDFIEAVSADVKKQTKIAASKVYTMAWSSSGPAVYTHLATKGNSIAGAFIAMSVFRPNELPAPETLTGKRVSLYHSPQDFIKIQMARDGETFLKSHGATVRFEEYQGGHGWRDDPFGGIRRAIAFLLQ